MQGEVRALIALSEMYRDGFAVKQDLTKAYMLAALAYHKSSDKTAGVLTEQLALKLSPQAQGEAIELAMDAVVYGAASDAFWQAF